MTKEYSKQAYHTSLAALTPTVDKIRLLLGSVRQAFNRSSLEELEATKKLQDTITLDLDEFFEDLEMAQAQPANADNFYLTKLQGILGHLEHIADEIKQMGDPIRRKIRESTLIADKDFFHVNDLFTHGKGLLRGLTDLFLAENKPLKRYLLAEADNIIQGCFQAEVDHDLRMSQSFGQPHAFAIYLEILEKFKKILHHLTAIVKIVDEKPAKQG